ncbi:MAG: tetratricopeptide repeat-containing sensor histidine kinase, partial [Candidatus Cloacimonetes bacterium]|nr:tetratricopeptide repeat-containing sensor histidine kinase [Candidatus Cloacimonadota bacterium]
MRIGLVVFFLLFLTINLNSENTFENLIDELTNAPENQKAEIYNKLAEENWYNAPAKSVEYGEAALEIARKYNQREMEASALINIGNGYLFSGEFDKAKNEYLQPGLILSRKIGYEKGLVGAMNSLGAISMNLGDYDTALHFFTEALDLLREQGDKEKIAKLEMNIASLYTSQGDYDKAVEYFFASLGVFEEIGDELMVARTLNNIAIAYHSWENYDKALEYYQKSLATYEKLEDLTGTAIPLNNIGEIYKDRGDYDIALDYYLRSLTLSEKSGNPQYIAVAQQGAGEAFKGLGNYDLASDYLLKALHNFQQIGFQEGVARTYLTLGRIALEKKELKKAREYLEKCLELAEKLSIKDLLKDSYDLFSQVYIAEGNFRNALEFYRSYSEIKDSLFKETTSRKFAELDIKYMTASREKEISLLKNENNIRKLQALILLICLIFLVLLAIAMFSKNRLKTKVNRQLQEANIQITSQKEELERMNQKLAEANATKNKFFSIIAHDLKNAFNSLRAGSRLLSEDISAYDSETIKSLAREIRASSEKIFSLLQNLLEWAKVSTGRISMNQEEINLKELIRENMRLNEGLAAAKQIKILENIEADIRVYADRNMLNSVVQSLIHNAIKFSNPESVIRIEAARLNDEVRVAVIDHGIGIRDEDM